LGCKHSVDRKGALNNAPLLFMGDIMKKIAVCVVVFYSLIFSQTKISGTIVGANGKPTPMAHVHLDVRVN